MRKLVVIAALALGVSGCANTEVPSAGSTTTPPSSTSDESTTTPESPTATSVPTPSPTGPGRSPTPSAGVPKPPGANEVTLDGVVQAGVEDGCVLLVSQGAQYLLLGGDPAVLREGRRVIVRGQAQPGVATTCQQGVPFIVAEVMPG